MQINYKAVYALMDKSYSRRSLKEHVKKYPNNIFKGSLLMANQLEDYNYLAVMVNKIDELSEKYILFIKAKELPKIIEAKKNLSLYEFAYLYTKTSIKKSEFETVVYEQAKSRGEDPKAMVNRFRACIKVIKSPIPQKLVGAEKTEENKSNKATK